METKKTGEITQRGKQKQQLAQTLAFVGCFDCAVPNVFSVAASLVDERASVIHPASPQFTTSTLTGPWGFPIFILFLACLLSFSLFLSLSRVFLLFCLSMSYNFLRSICICFCTTESKESRDEGAKKAAMPPDWHITLIVTRTMAVAPTDHCPDLSRSTKSTKHQRLTRRPVTHTSRSAAQDTVTNVEATDHGTPAIKPKDGVSHVIHFPGLYVRHLYTKEDHERLRWPLASFVNNLRLSLTFMVRPETLTFLPEGPLRSLMKPGARYILSPLAMEACCSVVNPAYKATMVTTKWQWQ